MPQKSSTFVQETRERESWLSAVLEKEGQNGQERAHLLATAALVRGTLEAIPVPEEAEERSRAMALAEMERLRRERREQRELRAPWYLRLGHLMRYVFTLGRRR